MSGIIVFQITLGTLLIPSVTALGIVVGWKKMRSTEAAQTAERFDAATEALTSDRLERRIDAIYELRRLAAEKRKNRRRVVADLCAFLRTSASATAPRGRASAGEIAEALEVIRSLAKDARARHPFHLDLCGTDLRGVEMNDLPIPGADFSRGLLGTTDPSVSSATFVKTLLRRAKFVCADVSSAKFLKADLAGATLLGARAVGTTFIRADLRGADFRASDCRRALFHRAEMDGADFRGADLSGAEGLTTAQLAGVLTDDETILPIRLRVVRPGLYDAIRKRLRRFSGRRTRDHVKA